MESRLNALRELLEDALDDLSSPRTSSETMTEALRTLEQLLASACVPKRSTDELDYFLALQYTFECNVPSRILSWIVSSTFRLDMLTNKGTIAPEAEPEVAELGVCLTHPATKRYLGRKYALEVSAPRPLPLLAAPSCTPYPSGSPSKPTPNAPGPLPLASALLDTLLCILVDAPPALRVFEACHGVHAVVRILKRAGTPREVRMKCLEFLYFYLLDETATAAATQPQTPTATAPSTPMQPQSGRKPFLTPTPARPLSRYGSSTFSLTSSSFASSTTSRSTSGDSSSSARSFSSTSSNASSAPSVRSASPTKTTQFTTSPTKQQFPPPASPTKPKTQTQTPATPRPQPRALMMLRREVDFVPLSPKAPAPARPTPKKAAAVVGARGRVGVVSVSGEREGGGESEETDSEAQCCGGEEADAQCGTGERRGDTRTTEEKKKLLGTMLGNVEALVEGVRKAGVWGLG
ncbi:cell division control protein 14, SIN component-domain-containing protein [Mycena rosella]|uniref:Cell division control protein 14, SIN component-domain-containing protein n=1 Tax=Mycena rosella TaxID=1033263 RepID=A0AAD7CX25_MYCRO|nr:cell division control protein 14, SIN component-domain-containing protein [Mycena rosella]